VLDGVLQVAVADGWRSGPGALPGEDNAGVGEGRLAETAVRALRCAQALAPLGADAIAARLYRYGRRPVTAAWRRRLGDETSVARFCGLEGGEAGQALAGRFVETGERSYWRLWRARDPPRREAGPMHKLYVSPEPDAIAAVLAVAGETLHEASALKLARGLEGILRPDKIVAYFADLDDLHAAATRMRAGLAGHAAHGVAFTAAVTSDGLLSWGVDPPAAGPAGSESWRLWLCRRLADELVAARGASPEPWRAALARLRLDGVDTTTWVPEARLFGEAR
jgi:hypothetical protein